MVGETPALVGQHGVGDAHLPKDSVTPRVSRRSSRRTTSVSVSRLGWVYQSPENGVTRARRLARSSSRTSYERPWCRYIAPLWTSTARAPPPCSRSAPRGDVDDREGLRGGGAQRDLGGRVSAVAAGTYAPREAPGRRRSAPALTSTSAWASQRGPRNSASSLESGPRVRRTAGASGRSARSRDRGSQPPLGAPGSPQGGGRRTGRARPRRDVEREPATAPAGRPTSGAARQRCPGTSRRPRRRAPDVDPELECVGCDHGEQLAPHQTALELAALLSGVAAR